MEAPAHISGSATAQIRQAVSAALGCPPRQTPRGLEWARRKDQPGIRSACLRAHPGGLHELEMDLAAVSEATGYSVLSLWHLAAGLIKETDLAALPVEPAQDDDGVWRIAARLSLRDAPFDLPRLQRLDHALEVVDRAARQIQAELPVAVGAAPDVPAALREVVEPFPAGMKRDSGAGKVAAGVLACLRAGLPVAMVGGPARVRLEMDRLARLAPNLVLLRRPTAIQKLPQLSQAVKEAGLLLAAPCGLLRPRMSVYEQGRELDAALQELASAALGVLTSGTRAELEAVFAIGQGRQYSPLLPVIETLPPAADADLVRAILAGRRNGLGAGRIEKLVEAVLKVTQGHLSGPEAMLGPLSNLAADIGPAAADLPQALATLARDLAGRKDTFGTCEEAPAQARPQAVCAHLKARLRTGGLAELLASRILGQDRAVGEMARRVWQEVVSRPEVEPLRLLLAGPVGTGKSVAVKYLAELLEWPYHYVDATAFDSTHAVMTSLAGASPGIVNSYNDGVLARISRRPSVVEIADLDHAQPGVKEALAEFFLRILQEGTLQTGSGSVVRTIPSLIFVFTSNVAYGVRKATAHIGFGELTREEVRERVMARTIEHLGHAFVSRVGRPVLFDEFTRRTALQVAGLEVEALTRRATGAERIDQSHEVAETIVDSLATLETGARAVIEAARACVAEALRSWTAAATEVAAVRCRAGRVVIEADGGRARRRAGRRGPRSDRREKGKDSGT